MDISKQLMEELERLNAQQQEQVLRYARELRTGLPPAPTGAELLSRLRGMSFPSEDLAEIQQAIEEGCEKVDMDEWDLPS